MTVKTLAFVQSSSEVKVSKDKIVTLSLDKKNEKLHKLDGAYNIDSGLSEGYKTQISNLAHDVSSGINSSCVSFWQETSDESALLSLSMKDIFDKVERGSSKNEYLVTVSMLQMTKEGQRTDLISPHGRLLEVKEHGKYGLYVEGLSQLICPSAEDAVRLFEDGCQVASALKLQPYITYFVVRVSSRALGSHPSSSTSASMKFINFHASKENLASISSMLASVSQKKAKIGSGGRVVDDILIDAFLGNNNAVAIAYVGGRDVQGMNDLLSCVVPLSGIGSSPQVTRDDTDVVLQQLRHEIGKVRDRLAKQSPPNKDDLSHMEKLMSDLDETKRTGWDQTILRSEQFLEERNRSLTNKGLIWIIESTKGASRENIKKLQMSKDKLTEEYKQQRQVSDRLNTELKAQIDSYTQVINSGKPNENDAKARVTKIQELKEQYRKEGDKLKDIKLRLKDVQDKLQAERQGGVQESSSSFDVAFQAMVEERDRTKQENEQLVEDELEKMKIEVEHEKADLQMKFSSNTLIKSNEEVLKHEIELVQLRSEMSVITTQLDSMRRERTQMDDHMRVLAEKHSRELEIQQLQNLQTFRAYREVFEEFKVELESRWRGLLDDAIQDAVFLNARNSELMEKNARLKLEVAQLKDDRSITKGSAANKA